MKTHVRDANPQDADAICQIYNKHVTDSIVTFETEEVSHDAMVARIEATQRNFPWLVLESDGVVTAYAYATTWRERIAYQHTVETAVYVAESSQGQGQGAAIYQGLIARLVSSDLEIHAALGGIALPNEASVRLHESLGFKKVAEFPEVGRKFGEWIDVGFWQLSF